MVKYLLHIYYIVWKYSLNEVSLTYICCRCSLGPQYLGWCNHDPSLSPGWMPQVVLMTSLKYQQRTCSPVDCGGTQSALWKWTWHHQGHPHCHHPRHTHRLHNRFLPELFYSPVIYTSQARVHDGKHLFQYQFNYVIWETNEDFVGLIWGIDLELYKQAWENIDW